MNMTEITAMEQSEMQIEIAALEAKYKPYYDLKEKYRKLYKDFDRFMGNSITFLVVTVALLIIDIITRW